MNFVNQFGLSTKCENCQNLPIKLIFSKLDRRNQTESITVGKFKSFISRGKPRAQIGSFRFHFRYNQIIVISVHKGINCISFELCLLLGPLSQKEDHDVQSKYPFVS